jgi:hypothetical protein
MSDDPKTWGYPTFAKDFPANEELARLVDAFARGDYATVRADAPKLKSDDEAVMAAAKLLVERTAPDPMAKYLFILAAALLAFLSLWWMGHNGHS